jgi:hypothetical protein
LDEVRSLLDLDGININDDSYGCICHIPTPYATCPPLYAAHHKMEMLIY